MPNRSDRRPGCVRLLAVTGPGDVGGTYQLWRGGHPDDSIPAVPFSQQLFELAEEDDASLLLLPNTSATPPLKDGRLELIPLTAARRGGFGHYLEHFTRALQARRLARRFQPDVIVVQSDLPPLAMLAFWGLPGQKIYEFHNSLWPRGREPRGISQLKAWVERQVLTTLCTRFLCVSEECRRQIAGANEEVRNRSWLFLPFYQGRLPVGTPVEESARPFKVLFAGRIEEEKGVFLILEAAASLEREQPGAVVWTLAGTGSKLDALRQGIAERGLEGIVEAPGHLDRPALVARIMGCHVTLTPTTLGFPEGLAQLPLESVIVGRPAIVSSVVPANDHLGEACVTIPPGSADAIRAVVAELSRDTTRYHAMVEACASEREQFLSGRFSYKNVLRQVLQSLGALSADPAPPQVYVPDTGR